MRPSTCLQDVLARLEALPFYDGQATHVHRMPPRQPQFAPLLRPLPASLGRALAHRGITRFFTHQAEAINGPAVGSDDAIIPAWQVPVTAAT